MSRLKEFREFRERMNARILDSGNLEIKRFFALDARAYEEGALPVKTKELMGLVASLVLRCDDCVTYHLVRCREEGVTRAEFLEALNVGLVVGILGIGAGDRCFSVAKLFFAYGLGNAMYFPFAVGATTILWPGAVTAATAYDIVER